MDRECNIRGENKKLIPNCGWKSLW